MKKDNKHYKTKDLETILKNVNYSNWGGWIIALDNYLYEKNIKPATAIEGAEILQQIKQYLDNLKNFNAITIAELEE